MSEPSYQILNTGARMPAIGFGTWEITPDENAKRAVAAALEAGYRLIDTAKIYGNEKGVGEAIRESGIPREDLFVTTKLWNDDQGYDSALRACADSLDKLGLGYLDLYLIHWPATKKRHDSWKAFAELHNQGVIKAAGVSNYTIDHLEDFLQRHELTPAVNQVEFHPFIYKEQKPLLDYCRGKHIVIEAYSPISRLGNADTAVIEDIARRVGKSPQQVVLRWCLEQATVPLPRSRNAGHIKDNLEVFDFELSEADIRRLNNISDGQRVTWDPAGMG